MQQIAFKTLLTFKHLQVCGQSKRNGAITCLAGNLSQAAPPKGSVDVSFQVRELIAECQQ